MLDKTSDTKNTLFDCMYMKFQGPGGRKVGSDCSWIWGFFVGEGRGVTKIFWNQIIVIIAHLQYYIKNHKIVHFKGMNFMICELCLS